MQILFLKIIGISLFLILSLCSSSAQEPFAWQLTDKDGLPSLTVYKVAQDQEGFIWVGTASGICRFDGLSFKQYDSPLLQDPEILNLQIDHKNRVWFSNLTGQLFWIENDSIHLFEPKQLEEEISIKGFSVFENDEMFFTYKNKKGGYLRAAQYSNDSIHVFPEHYVGGGSLEVFEQKAYLSVRVGPTKTDRSIERKFIVKEFNSITRAYTEVGDLTDIGWRYYGISNLKGGSVFLWFRKLMIGDYENWKSIDLGFDDLKINSLLPQGSEQYLLTENGFFVFNNKSIANLTFDRHIFKGINTTWVHKDIEGNIWVSTDGDGLFMIPNIELETYTSLNSELCHDKIFSLASLGGGGVAVGLGEGNLAIIEKDSHPVCYSSGSRGRILFVKKDDPWLIYGGDDGTMKYDLSKNKTEKWINISTSKSIEIDAEGDIWIGRSNGISMYKKDLLDLSNMSGLSGSIPENLVKRLELGANIGKLFNSRVYAMELDNQGKFWVGTTNSLYYLDGRSLKPFFTEGKEPAYRISGIEAYKDNGIYVSTLGDGIIYIDSTGHYKHYTTEDGLSSNHCKTLFPTDEEVWIGTDKGLNIFNIERQDFRTISVNQGLPSNEVNAVLVDQNEAWIGTPRGLAHFSLDVIEKKSYSPLIYINKFCVWEQDTTLSTHFDLRYDQNNIMIEFIGLDYASLGSVDYKYRMIGLDSNWTYTSSPFARYPVLNPNKYEFQVHAINQNGFESKEPAIITLDISAPFWDRQWFRILVALLLIAAVWLITNWRIKINNERQRLKSRLNTLRMQALQAQMNPHFVFNILNAIQHFITQHDREQAMLYLSRFAKLIRQIFEQSSEKEISLTEELELLELYLELEKLRFKDKVSVHLNVDQQVKYEADMIKLPPLLIQPLIENAFKHGLLHKKDGKGKLEISFEKDKGHLKCTIEDNGVGREKSKEINQWRPKSHRSSGTNSAIERLKIYHQSQSKRKKGPSLQFHITDMLDDNLQPSGTKVELWI